MIEPCDVTDLETHVGASVDGQCGAPKPDGTICSLKAGWGTEHVGLGHCRHHGGVPATRGAPDVEIMPLGSYAPVIRNEKLRNFVLSASKGNALDSLDAEIALAKGIAAYLADMIGVEIKTDPVTGEIEEVEAPHLIEEQAKDILRVINTIISSYKAKYGVLAQLKETIPRAEVRAYVENIKNVLEREVRDDCPTCGADLGILEAIFEGIAKIQHL